MFIDAVLPLGAPDVGATARSIEDDGYDGLWVGETNQEPFMQLLRAVEATREVQIGSSVVIAFARTPMTVAAAGYDLAGYSSGRFILGLGSQVQSHIERRFSMPWSRPALRMREFILAVRAIWASWHESVPLAFEGEFYRHTLMTPFFTPPAHRYGPPPIYLGAVGPLMTEVAGEVADGFLNHGFTTDLYMRTVSRPALLRGRARVGSADLSGFAVAAPALVAVGRDREEIDAATAAIRDQIAFYASTPSYRSVLDLHGWGELQPRLQGLAREGHWDRMRDLVSDDILHAVATVGDPQTVAAGLRTRWSGVADRMTLCTPAGTEPAALRELMAELRSHATPLDSLT